MPIWKRAGTWLAVGVAVVAMSWTVREIEAHATPLANGPSAEESGDSAPTVNAVEAPQAGGAGSNP